MLQDKSATISYLWRDWEDVPTAVPLAIVAAEDQQFPVHYGFDFQQIQHAYADFRSGHRLRGASTITQQVCKNLFLWPSGGLFRKGVEAICAVHLELLWPKRRILEIYLNIAEFGPGVYGVQAASQYYFQSQAHELQTSQIVQLVTLLPNPKAYSTNLETEYLRDRHQWVLRQMRQLGDSYLSTL